MDLLILQALRERAKFRQLRSAVPDSMLGAETVSMLAWFRSFFDAFPDKDRVDVPALQSLFTLRAGDSATPEQLAVMRMLIAKLDAPVDPGLLEGINQQLYERDFSGKAAALINAYEAGDEVDLTYELGRLSQENMRRMSATSPASYIDTPIETILATFEGDRGLKLPTNILRTGIGGLQGGDTMLVAGRPDKGKTSLLAAIATHFAKQLRPLGLAGRPILWCSNEGAGIRIVPRVYQAALAVEFDELVKLSNAGVLKDQYTKATDSQDIRIKDIHGATMGQVEQIVEQMKPCVLILDMPANIKMGSIAGGNKTDALEAVWQELREMAVRHDFVGIGTAQISTEGDNMLYPGYGAIKDSKTSVQGAVDVMLMMGALNTPDMASLRGFSTPKNKRAMKGSPSHIQSEVYFDSAKCQFLDGTG